jgi:hypothetical protein
MKTLFLEGPVKVPKMAPKGQTVEQKRAKALTWFKKQKTFFHIKVNFNFLCLKNAEFSLDESLNMIF